MTKLRQGLSRLFSPKAPEPSYPRLPAVDDQGQTTVPGVYAVGEVAGTPLIKLGINAGHELVERLAPELARAAAAAPSADPVDPVDLFDLVILGAGAAGLSAAATAAARGLRVVVLEANHLAETVYTMTKGKVIYAEPDSVAKAGPLWFEECGREELLARWATQVAELGLDVRTHECVLDVQRDGEHLVVTSDRGTYRCRRFVLAAGKAGNPRKAGVPGEVEHAARIDHRLVDPDLHRDQDILVYGGGDVALEAALALGSHNRVTLATIDAEFSYANRRNVEALRAMQRDGRVTVHLATALRAVGPDTVTLQADGAEWSIANDHVFEMIGAELPLAFFAKLGVELEGTWNLGRWLYLLAVFAFVYSFYSIKSYGKGLVATPWESLISPESFDAGVRVLFEWAFLPFAGLFTDAALADILSNRGYQCGYLYSLIYTILMVVFGIEAMRRWRGIARDGRHQTWRYVTLLAFQVGFFLIVNIVAVQALSTQYAWRAWGLYQPFPLFFNTFFWFYDGDPIGMVWFFVGAGLFGSLLAIPYLSLRHGKRFCTWVCGCGGLAETLGDRWRHLAPKGRRSRGWEFQGVAILLLAVLVLLVVFTNYGGNADNGWWHVYSYIVDFWLVAVIPMALYPFFGGKIWCRYWCPLAAWNGLLARWYGRLRIVSTDRCISCAECSKQCQVGVDVMAFAKDQAELDNRNSACIQCGICIDVCPMDVLSFDASPRATSSRPS